MAKNAESTIQGLNIIPTTDTLSGEISPMSDDINRDLEAQLAMWTHHFQFPNSNTLLTSSSSATATATDHPDASIDEDERVFSPERDNASRSRHKAIPVEDFASGHFFGNVGASLAHHPAANSYAAAHERAKFQQLQQHLLHNNDNNNNNNNGHDNNAAVNAGSGGDMGDNQQMNDLFSFFPNDDLNLNPALVDPFLNPSDVAAATGVGGTGGGYLPPLTIHPPTHGRPHPQQQHSAFPGHNMPQMQMQQQTIDPATTTLGHHRVTLPFPATTCSSMKRQQKKGGGGGGTVSSSRNVIIPVDHDYTTAPNSAIGGDDEEDMDHDSYRLHNNPDDPNNNNGMDGLIDDLTASPLPAQVDASGNPIPYSAAEDKRRRNTLASARFRQKKKEREAAMERKARALDERVGGLERECESLRKENRMLRGLLVDGVPAASSFSNTNSSSSSNANSSSNSSSNANSNSTSSNSTEEISDGKNVIGAGGAGASVVLLEELVRLLRANSAVLSNNGNASGQGQRAPAPTPANGRTGATGKRKRGGGGN